MTSTITASSCNTLQSGVTIQVPQGETLYCSNFLGEVITRSTVKRWRIDTNKTRHRKVWACRVTSLHVCTGTNVGPWIDGTQTQTRVELTPVRLSTRVPTLGPSCSFVSYPTTPF